MESERWIGRLRSWYAALLRLYPTGYRARFGEPMEQTFHDLLRERAAAQRGVLRLAVWLFADSLVGAIRENLAAMSGLLRVVRSQRGLKSPMSAPGSAKGVWMSAATPQRLALAAAALAVSYLWTYQVPSLLIPVRPELLQPFHGPVALGLAAAAAWLVWSMASRAPAGLVSRVLLIAALGCVIGFVAGALSGPVLWSSKPNQGLLLGLFFTAPAGAVLGGLAAVISSKRAKLGQAA